jgi:long-chain acyl-CoA synthetase
MVRMGCAWAPAESLARMPRIAVPFQPPIDEAQRARAWRALPDAIATGMSVALWANLTPNAPAIVSDHGQLSFQELNARCNQLVRGLRACGLQSGDSVALMCSNCCEFAQVFWSARRAGWRLTTVNWHLTGDEAAYIVDDCDAKAFIVDARFATAASLVVAKAPRVTAAIVIGGSLPGFREYEQVLQGQPDHDISDPELGTLMLYTSGTTGRPKGVHRVPAPMPAAVTSPTVYKLGEGVHLATGPLYHAASLSFSLAIPNGAGAAVVMMDGWDAEHALQLIDRYRVTHTHMVPTMFQRLLSLPDNTRARYDVSSLVYVLHGAAPCPPSVKRAMIDWLGPILYEYYAATEGVGTHVDSMNWLRKPGTVGQVAPTDQIRILDDAGTELPRNQPGLVYIKAPDQARFTYYKDDTKTQKAYRDHYYTLGDVGYIDEDGYLFLTDRSADLVISGGVNIYPAEVEAVLYTHPAVADVGVIGVPNSEWGEEVKAVVIVQPGYTPSPLLAAELIDHCRARLAHFKCPRSVDFVTELPRHDNGKLYKHKLRAHYRQQG